MSLSSSMNAASLATHAMAQLLPASSGGGNFTTFSLFATSLGAGIAVSLLVVPVAFIGRKFFILMSFVAVVFFSLALAAMHLELSYFHVACAALLIVYNVILPPETGVDQSERRERLAGGPRPVWRALARISILAAAACGLLGLVEDAGTFPGSLGFPGAQGAWLACAFISSALLLGAAATGMVLGHWYLVVKNPSFVPLARVTWLLLAALGVRLVTAAATGWGQAGLWEELLERGGVMGVFLGPGIFVLARWVFGLLAPLVLGWMTWRCVQIKSNQSATGILYVVLAFVLIGEIIAKHFLLSERLVL